jgi:hypothetical protein
MAPYREYTRTCGGAEGIACAILNTRRLVLRSERSSALHRTTHVACILTLGVKQRQEEWAR